MRVLENAFGESTYNLSGKISDFQSLMAGSSLVMYSKGLRK